MQETRCVHDSMNKPKLKLLRHIFTVYYKYHYTEIIKTVLYLICNRIVNDFVGVQERLAAVNHIYVFREAMRLALNM